MPIPNWRDPKEIEKEKWFKEVEYEVVKQIGSRLIYKRMLFTVDLSIPYVCGGCQSRKYLYLHVMPSGVYAACIRCKITSGPLPDKVGTTPRCKILEEREVDIDEAIEVVRRTKQIPPPMIRRFFE